MATWSSSTWQNYGSDVNTGYDWSTLESVFNDGYSWIGTEWHNSGYRYRASRILFTTPAGGPINKLSFTSSAMNYRPMWGGSDDNKSNHPSISWKITAADDKTCITDASNPHGTISIVEADPWGTGRDGYFSASEVILPITLQPNTQYALWLFPTGGVKNTYNGYSFGDPDGYSTVTFTGTAATYSVTQYHYYEHVTNGWTHFNTTTDSVAHGSSFAPYNVSAPTGYYAGNNYGYYDANYASLGNGTVGQNSFTVTQNMYVHVHYYPNNYSYNLNVLLPDGSEPYSTGTAGSVECSINGGAYSRIYNEGASSYPYGSTFNFRNFTPGTGMYLSSVSGVSGSGPWSATMGTGGLNINFYTAYNTYTNYIYHYKWNPSTNSWAHQVTTSFNGTYGSSVTIPSSHVQSYTGYHNTGSSGSYWGTSTWSNKTIGATFTQPAGSVSIEYYYEPDTYTVSYNANGGSGAPDAQTKTYGVTLTLSSTKPTKASTVTKPTGTITISYAANGGSSTPSASTGTYTNQKTVPYSFSHWNTASNNSGTTYYSGGTYTANAGAILYAQYSTGSATETRYSNPSIKTAAAISRADGSVTGYKVTFNANGGSSTSAITSTKTRKYTFAHWKNTSSGSIFSASTNYTFSANATLTAQWTSSDTNDAIKLPGPPGRDPVNPDPYTVTLDPNGGSVTPTSLTATRTTSYTFAGWKDSGGTTYAANASYTPSAATTLTAQWNSSTSTASVTLPTPTRSGYEFLGWGTSKTATSGITGSYTPTGNITLYALWKPTGTVEIYSTSAATWEKYHAYIYNSSTGTWELYMPKIYNGSNWNDVYM